MDSIIPIGAKRSAAKTRPVIALDEEQAPERGFDGLLLARSNQEPYISNANRV